MNKLDELEKLADEAVARGEWCVAGPQTTKQLISLCRMQNTILKSHGMSLSDDDVTVETALAAFEEFNKENE